MNQMTQLSRTQTPPGGWIFFQAQTGWSVPNPVSQTFNQAVDLILKHRLSNPAVTKKFNLSTSKAEVGDELENFTRRRLGLPPLESPPKLMPRPSWLSPAVAGAVADIKRAAQGTAVILDWLTSGGKPVAKELAEKRAATCVACPNNKEGSWYTVAPAEIIRETLEARKDLTLETSHDAELKSCHVCKCLMRLKVWTPLDHIVKNTRPEILREFPSHCWIVTEK